MFVFSQIPALNSEKDCAPPVLLNRPMEVCFISAGLANGRLTLHDLIAVPLSQILGAGHEKENINTERENVADCWCARRSE